jgi:hypothetical protein
VEPVSDMEMSASVPWSGVFTSRIDSKTVGLFAAQWRRVVPIVKPSVGRFPRSPTELQIRFLYGNVALPEGEQPPKDELEVAQWEDNAAGLLNALTSTLLTPRGTLIIDGWGADDWLEPKHLYAMVQKLNVEQAHLFSVTADIESNPFVVAAAKHGQLTLYPSSFGEFTESAADEGYINFEARSGSSGSKIIPIGNDFAQIDISTWNQVTASARPIDVTTLEPFTRTTKEITYQRYRNFMGSAEGSPPWKAIASGFAFERKFHNELRARVERAIDDNTSDSVIILAGQAATGKSIACASLAIAIARAGRAPVLFQSKRGERPQLDDVEAFVAWSESRGAPPTVLVWDGMTNPDEYYILARQLRSRGRRAVVVGTAYLNYGILPSVIAPAEIGANERDNLRAWLAEYGIGSPVPNPGTVVDTSLLAFIYRALPETERTFRRGLTLELRNAETGIEQLVRNGVGQEDTRLSSVAQALVDAGISMAANPMRPSETPDAELHDLSLSERSTAERLTAVVLVVGQWGMSVPLDLLLRILGSEGSHQIVSIVRRYDILRWNEDERGEQSIGTRTALEARLMAREDLTAAATSDVVEQLIAHLKVTSDRSGGPEVSFFADLMEKMGPQSKVVGSRYGQYFKIWADALRENRLGGPLNVRMALIEANLLREYTRLAQRREDSTSEERTRWLQDSQELLELALEDSDTNARTRLNLYVELASSIGFQANELVRNSQPDPEQIRAMLRRVLLIALRARAYDPENFYPVDVVAWSTRDVITHFDAIPIADRLEFLANAAASLDSVEEVTLSPSQHALYLDKRASIASLLDAPELEEQYLRGLTDNSDPTAVFLLARRAGREAGPRAAFEVLVEGPSSALDDWKCSRLLFESYWEATTGQRFLRGERNTLPFTRDEWGVCLEVIDKARGTADFDQYRVDFAQGLALFHLGEITNAIEVFRDLDRESGGLSNRVNAIYLVSENDGSGRARHFSGRVRWASPDGKRGQVWVEQLRAFINFIPERWATNRYRAQDEVLPEFQISFNMRGPLAEPIRHGGGR